MVESQRKNLRNIFDGDSIGINNEKTFLSSQGTFPHTSQLTLGDINTGK